MNLNHRYLAHRNFVVNNEVEEWLILEVTSKAYKIKSLITNREFSFWKLKSEIESSYTILEDLGYYSVPTIQSNEQHNSWHIGTPYDYLQGIWYTGTPPHFIRDNNVNTSVDLNSNGTHSNPSKQKSACKCGGNCVCKKSE